MDLRLPDDFKEFLALLNSERIDYLLVGGFAVILHGYSRFTGDLDIWVAVASSKRGEVDDCSHKVRVW